MTTPITPSPFQVIDDSKKQLAEALSNITPDEFLISGILNFVRSKFLSFIVKDINDSIRKSTAVSSTSDLELAQRGFKQADETAEALIDRIWSDFYHPVFKYYQSQFHDLKNEEIKYNRKRGVEMRKLNEKFRKLSKLSSDFYLDLLKHILTQHRVGFIVPETFYEFLNLTMASNALEVKKSDNATVVKMVYIVHRSLLFLGTTSRYRSSLSQFLPKADREGFNRALEYCHYSELLLPAFGEARNHIGMIYNAQGDALQAAYEFLRSALARIPSQLGTSNYKVCLSNTTQVIDDLNRLRLDNNVTSRNRFKHLSTYFLVLYGFHFNPQKWKKTETTFINGTPVKEVRSDLYKIITDLASKGNDVFLIQKLFIMLIGGISLSGAVKSQSLTPELTNLFQFSFEFIDVIEKFFIEQWSVDKSKSLKLLPLIRLLFSWLRVNKLALQYAHRDSNFLKNTAILLNLLFKYSPETDFSVRPKREQYFLEDIGLKEFTPVDRLFWDFDDSHIFESPDSANKLIGKFKNHDEKEETKLRVEAVGYLGKKIINANRVGIKFEADKKCFNVDNMRDLRMKKIPGLEPKKPKPTETKQETPTVKKNNKRRGKGKKNQQQTKPETSKKAVPIRESSSSSSSSSGSEGIVEISQNSFERRNNIHAQKSENSAPPAVPKEPTKAHQAVISIEELENKLTNARKDENYANMVDSLVDDTFASKSASQTSNEANANWKSTPQQQPQATFNRAFSPNINNSNNNGIFTNAYATQSPFSTYPSYFPGYPQVPPPPQQQQQQILKPSTQSTPQPVNNLYRQYQSIYSPYGISQITPQSPQQPVAQTQQSPFNMYGYGAYPQYGHPPVTQVPETPPQYQPPGQHPQNQQTYPNGNEYQFTGYQS